MLLLRAPLATEVRAEEQEVFTTQADHLQSILRDVVLRLCPAILLIFIDIYKNPGT
ncbi:MAG: hypothetical protein XXXJIFNMEKO3_02018 [Candidatus Erwinia impunctatus]|nr:hypothetical protein XXXJIFNMEKO_02018 [Culicoides impunctatus]